MMDLMDIFGGDENTWKNKKLAFKTDDPLKEDILLLEDIRNYQVIMGRQIPEGLSYTFVRNGQEFEEYLSSGCQARVYSLDDHVPDASGFSGFHFIEHCNQLLEQRPDAKVFYHGSSPGTKECAYCDEHNIQMVDREDVGYVIKKELNL